VTGDMKTLIFTSALLLILSPLNALFYGESGAGMGYVTAQTTEDIYFIGWGNDTHIRNIVWQDYSSFYIGGKLGFQLKDNSPFFLAVSSNLNYPLGLYFAPSVIYYYNPYLQLSTSYGYLASDEHHTGAGMDFSIAYDYGKDRGSLTGIKVFTSLTEYKAYSFMLFYSYRFTRSSAAGGSGTKFPTRQRL